MEKQTRGKKSELEAAQIVGEIQRKEIEAFRITTASDVVAKILSSVNSKSFENKKITMIGWGNFHVPKEVTNSSELSQYLLRSAASRDDVDWLLKRVEYAEGKFLNDLKAEVKQNATDVSNNQWFFALFDKIRNIEIEKMKVGADTMSVQQLAVLALIAKAGDNGVTTTDICETLDTTLSSIQRQLGRLGGGYAFKSGGKGEVRERSGLKLIKEFEDPNNRKAKRWVLTMIGIKFFKQLNSVKV